MGSVSLQLSKRHARPKLLLQALAILHFVRGRPDSLWLWIILIGDGVGALTFA